MIADMKIRTLQVDEARWSRRCVAGSKAGTDGEWKEF